MLTVKGLRSRPKDGRPDEWESDDTVRGSGALWARKSSNGVMFYFGYSHAGRKPKYPLGAYDESGIGGLTLEQARQRYGEISKIYRSGVTDIHGHFERERAAAERTRKAEEEAARRAAEESRRGTLRQLLTAYVDHLKRAGKVSDKEVRGIFDRHVVESDEAEEIIDRRAADLTTDDFVDVIGTVVEAGKGRQAGKLRSYLRAAYQIALESKTDADLIALRSFGIATNPIASIGALSKYNRARDRNLSAPEMTAFLKRLDVIEAVPQRAALSLCLYLGGQRPTQLLRAKATDIDIDGGTITIYDPKGKRKTPRRHVLPLVKEVATILATRLAEIAKLEDVMGLTNVPVFSTDNATRINVSTLSALVHDISAEMVKAREAREPFMMSDLRRTAETMMAALKVSSDIRAQVQSHGLGGVQNRHYDRHGYALEKQQTLKKWAAYLAKLKEGKTAEITTISAARSRKDQRDAH